MIHQSSPDRILFWQDNVSTIGLFAPEKRTDSENDQRDRESTHGMEWDEGCSYRTDLDEAADFMALKKKIHENPEDYKARLTLARL